MCKRGRGIYVYLNTLDYDAVYWDAAVEYWQDVVEINLSNLIC